MPAHRRSAAQTGRERLEIHEARYSSRLSSRNRSLCLREQFSNAFHRQGRQAERRNLLQLPSLLHRQAEACGHRRPRRALHQEVRRRRSQIRRQEVGFPRKRNRRGEISPGRDVARALRTFFLGLPLFCDFASALHACRINCDVATQSRMFESGSSLELVESAPPRVTLRNAFAHPFDSAIAAARTCYSPRLIGPEEITDKQRLNIGAGTFFSGHHTVYQHAHFEFGLENVSRQFVWSFLHAHPFYNSEQQSPPYLRMDRVEAYIPPAALFFDAESRRVYERAVNRAWSYYRQLSSLLLSDARRILEDIWHVGPLSHPKRIQ